MDEDVTLASRLGWEALVQHHSINGQSIAVATSQAQPSPAGSILLLHGFPTSSWDWHKIWPQLSAQYQLIAPDFLGFGLSDKPKGHLYRIADQADLCESILADHNMTRCHVLSHDYGDTVAQELLARQKDRNLSFEIDRVVMLNGGILPNAHRPRPIQTLLAGPLGPMLNHLLTKKRFKTSFSQVFGPNTQPVDAELNMMWDFITLKNGHKISHALLHYLAERKKHAARWVPTVLSPNTPMLQINGSLDPVSGAYMMQEYRAQGGSADIIELPNVGHYPQLEAAEQTASAILEFLAH